MLKISQQLKIHWPEKPIEHASQKKAKSSSTLLNWYVKPAQLKDMDMVLFVNEATLTPIVVPGIDFFRVDVRMVFQEVLLQKLALGRVNREKARTYIDACLSGEKFEPNLTTNFMVEKAYQEYRSLLAEQTIDLVHDQEEGRLMQDLVNLGHQLTTKATCLPNQQPSELLAEKVNEEITVAAERGDHASKLRAAYDQWAEQRSLTPKQPGFKQACQQIRELNAHFMAGFKDWLSQSIDKETLADVLKVVDDFQNHYLLSKHPLTICDDLTAACSYLMANMPQNDQQAAVTYLRAFDLMGQYIMGIKLWTDDDFKVYHDSVIDGSQGLVDSDATVDDNKAAYQKMTINLIRDLVTNQTDILKVALEKLSQAHRDKLVKLLASVNAEKKRK